MIIFFSTLPPFTTGQSKCFLKVAENASPEDIVITSIKKDQLIYDSIIFILNILKLIKLRFAKGKNITFYFCGSRSNSGLLKDLLLTSTVSWFGWRIINHIHGSDYPTKEKNPLGSIIAKQVLNKCHVNIVLTKTIQDQLRLLGCHTTIVIIPNFSEPLWNIYSNENNRDSDLILRLGYIGGLSEKKGTCDLLDAFIESTPKLTLSIWGAWYTKSRAERLTILEKLKILEDSGIGYYAGAFKGTSGLIDALKNIDILLLPSKYPTEAFPLILIECATCGIPVIISDINGIHKLIPEAVLNVLDSKNIKNSLKKVLSILSEDHKSYFERKNILKSQIATIRDKFDEKSFHSNIMRILRND